MSNIGDLGRPIGGGGAAGYTGTQQPDVTEFSEAGEHGQGAGVSGGHGVAHAGNSQAAAAGVPVGGGGGGFNGGLGSEHASAGIPRSGEHPIADKFMGESGGQETVSGAYKGGSTGDALTGQSHAHTTGAGVGHLGDNSRSSGLGAGAGAVGAGLAGSAIGGAYAGGSANDGLTGQSSAHTTGAGAGPLGENIHQDQSRAAALGSTAGAATAGAGAHSTQSGVGPAGGAGGHYSADQSHSHSGAGAGATGLGAAGVGAGAAGLAGSNEPASNSPLVNDGQAKGHYGHADQDDSRGHPISNPKDLDTGGPYSLVFQESTGKYVHRHELDGKK